MNGAFLKRIFSSPSFAEDYKGFLLELPELIIQDNHKKVIYLEELIQKAISKEE